MEGQTISGSGGNSCVLKPIQDFYKATLLQDIQHFLIEIYKAFPEKTLSG